MEKRKKVLICGMAKSGMASARLLARHGYLVTINDMKNDIPGLKDALNGIEYIDALGRDPMELVNGQDLVVLSPVIPIFAPFAKRAKELGAEVIGEIELGWRYCAPGTRFICISGTNGKTTTTALTGELFRAAGERTFVLGNIGVPITQEAENVRSGDSVVAEVAALQLESIVRFRPNAMGMLNISEDHLNRFENRMENYVAAKCRAFENQRAEDFAVLNFDDPVVRDMARLTKARVVYFSQERQLDEGMSLVDGCLTWRLDEKEISIVRPEELRIPGAHNVQNAMCAASLALCMGVEPEAVRKGLRRFPGVEHRIEFVREFEGVTYINDSKGTNPDSTIKAVQAMTRPTVLILGGYDKHSDFHELFEHFHGSKVKALVVLGATQKIILDTARDTG
ncbi:MAG: UDP-N-acetylmuramoyl-L-alanine--D-glutamate ligase, partial [Clostridia bacterium]|nr:UDP-N-acetylmuramoyl-L-alanine--D-glutamate ligase [Clostridia bacterium]